MDIVLADIGFNDIRFIQDYEVFDADCGDTNDFELRVDIADYQPDLTYGNVVYIPNTECGGIIGEIENDTSIDNVMLRGYMWRGLLQKKVIIPVGDYKIVNGDLADIVADIIGESFDSIFISDRTPTGVEVTNYQFERYCTVLDGLEKLLKANGYRLSIMCTKNGVVVMPKLITDHSDEIEFSQDSDLDFKIVKNKRGVNSLICLGKGELSARTVVNLYVWPDGSIQEERYYTGIDEIQEVYDYSSAEDRNALKEHGMDRLKELMSSDVFEMNVSELGITVPIGDIVGGRDYVTGIYMKQPVKSIVWRVENDVLTLDYSLEGSE